MTNGADDARNNGDAVDLQAEEAEEKKDPRRLVLLLLLLLLMVAAGTNVWVEYSPGEREFVTRNLECLQCHSELIPALSKASVHDPFLREDCRTCHTPHGSEVIERTTGGAWKLWRRFRTLLQWLPFKLACEALDTPAAAIDGGVDDRVISETRRLSKGEDSELTADRAELCWICHGDLARSKLPMEYQHAPFKNGFCTDCHDPHASDFRVLLRRDERDLCPSCHPMSDELQRVQLHPPYGGRFCTNCHDPHASEWEGVLVAGQRDLCFTCHPSVAPLSLKAVQHDPFLNDACTKCHEPHAADAMPLLVEDQPPLCYGCHPTIEWDFLKPSHHPVGTVQLDCVDCHNPHAADYEALLAAQDNEMCYECHARTIGLARAIRATYEDSGHADTLCIGCHTPHGSDYAPILRERNPQLCYRCHPEARNHDVNHPTNHPHDPAVNYDRVERGPMTCTSTCHDPHGSGFRSMVQVPYGEEGFGTDFVCLLCHYEVGVTF